jgi:hypothetical protein
MRRNVLITVSTGIGFDATRYLIARGYQVYGSVRTPAVAERLSQGVPRSAATTSSPRSRGDGA